MRGGTLLLISGVVGNAANYLFAVMAGRILGPANYGALTALLALTVVVGLPVTALQVTLARDVAFGDSHGQTAESNALLRAAARRAGLATIVLAAVSLLLMVPIAWGLNINPVWLVGVTALVFLPLILTAVFVGEIQARQRYGQLAIVTGLPSVARLFAFGAAVLVGGTLAGALWASVVGSLLGLALPAWWARDAFRRVQSVPISLHRFVSGLWPVVVGMVGITALTNVDLLMVKGRLPAIDAGLYGAASVLGKVAFFIPTAIVAVLFPRVAMRRAEGHETSDILGRALIVTLAFCIALFGLYAVAGEQIVALAFGAKFEASVPLLVPLGVGMTCFSVANVLVSYHLSCGRRQYATVLAISAGVQIVALLLIPAGLMTFIWVDAAIGIALLIAHELVEGSTLPALRRGLVSFRKTARGAMLRTHAKAQSYRRRAVEVVAVLLGFAALAIVLTWPLAPSFGSAIFGPQGDSFGAIQWLWSLPQEGGLRLTGQSAVHLTGFPFGWERGNGVNAQWIIIYGPAYFLSSILGPVVAYNLIILSGLALSGAAMYWLARYIGARPLVAIWAGIVFTMFPWHMERAEYHGSLAHLEWFPLLVIALIAWRRRPTGTRVLGVGGAMLLLWLTSGYYGLIGLIMAAVLILVALLSEGRGWGWAKATVRSIAAYAACIAAAVVVFAVGLIGGGAGGGVGGHDPVELGVYGARWWEWIVPPGASQAFGGATGPWLLARQHGSNTSETGLFVGWITILLAVTWLVWCIARRRGMTRDARYLLLALPATVLAGLLFALPHPLTVFGIEIPAPSLLIFEVAPQFRVSSRMIVVVMTALVPMAALGLQVVWRAIAHRMPDAPLARATGIAVIALACVGSVAELTVVPGVAITRLDLPPVYEALAKLPPGGIAEYPLTGPADPQMTGFLIWQVQHGRPLVNGGANGSFGGAVRESISNPHAPGTASTLAAMGVVGVIVRPPDSALTTPPPGFDVAYRGSDGLTLWRVTAQPSAVAVLGTGFGPGEDAGDGRWNHWLTKNPGEVVLWSPRAHNLRLLFSASSFARPRAAGISGESGRVCRIIIGSDAAVAVTVAVPRGFSSVRVTTRPGLQELPDGRFASIYSSAWHAEPASNSIACAAAKPRSAAHGTARGNARG